MLVSKEWPGKPMGERKKKTKYLALQYNPSPKLTQDLGHILHVFFVGVLFLTSSQGGVFWR